ncbi:MAG: hypothetical protein DA329_07400 [Candidatus Nitrosocosmicus sp.]|nr:hypothetical protein [Candidatus Nitrosocosmicus sp.]
MTITIIENLIFQLTICTIMPDYSSTFCTVCKSVVIMSDIKFVKLANSMVTIDGYCNTCGTNIMKGRVLPKTGKNPLAKYRRKLARKQLNVYRTKKK